MERKRLLMWAGSLIPAALAAAYCGLQLFTRIGDKNGDRAAALAEGIGYSLIVVLVAGVGGCIAVETAYWIRSIFKAK